MWINESKNQMNMRLDIGSGDPSHGENQPQGYVLQDAEAYENIDLACDIMDLPKFIKEGSCSEIRASHVIEHFGKEDSIKVIQMIKKLLKKGGLFNIIVPNFKWHAQLVMQGSEDVAVYYAFGGQRDKYDYHLTGYTPDILKKRLEENGFKIVRLSPATSIECLAINTS